MSMLDLRSELRASTMPGGPPYAQKDFVEGFLVRACDVMNIEGREPDAWEVQNILAAVGALATDWYRLAAACLDNALTPPEERAEEWRGPDPLGTTRQHLERAIYYIRGKAAPAV